MCERLTRQKDHALHQVQCVYIPVYTRACVFSDIFMYMHIHAQTLWYNTEQFAA